MKKQVPVKEAIDMYMNGQIKEAIVLTKTRMSSMWLKEIVEAIKMDCVAEIDVEEEEKNE